MCRDDGWLIVVCMCYLSDILYRDYFCFSLLFLSKCLFFSPILNHITRPSVVLRYVQSLGHVHLKFYLVRGWGFRACYKVLDLFRATTKVSANNWQNGGAYMEVDFKVTFPQAFTNIIRDYYI